MPRQGTLQIHFLPLPIFSLVQSFMELCVEIRPSHTGFQCLVFTSSWEWILLLAILVMTHTQSWLGLSWSQNHWPLKCIGLCWDRLNCTATHNAVWLKDSCSHKTHNNSWAQHVESLVKTAAHLLTYGVPLEGVEVDFNWYPWWLSTMGNHNAADAARCTDALFFFLWN